MTPTDLRRLLDYHYWARDRLLAAVEPLTAEQFTRDMGNSFRSIRDTLAHLYSGEWVWYSRWQGTSPTAQLPADLFPDLASIRALWSEHEQKMRAYVQALDDDGVKRVIEYRMLNGTPGSAPLWQMIQHVVNHATYHRGQVTTMLRQLGSPASKPLDLIAYYLETNR